MEINNTVLANKKTEVASMLVNIFTELDTEERKNLSIMLGIPRSKESASDKIEFIQQSLITGTLTLATLKSKLEIMHQMILVNTIKQFEATLIPIKRSSNDSNNSSNNEPRDETKEKEWRDLTFALNRILISSRAELKKRMVPTIDSEKWEEWSGSSVIVDVLNYLRKSKGAKGLSDFYDALNKMGEIMAMKAIKDSSFKSDFM